MRSSTSSTSAAAGTPGSTGGAISVNLRRCYFAETNCSVKRLKGRTKMKIKIHPMVFIIATLLAAACASRVVAQDLVKTANGSLEGISDKQTGIRSFKGI